jgi:alkylation response protein AidB-like acyl-CoA dehydrogenase
MDFTLDPADDSFREEVRAFLREHLPHDMARRNLRGYHATKEDMQAWTRILHRKAWSAPTWPVEYGGTGWSHMQRHIFEEECLLAGAPPACASAFLLVGPVIYTFGSEQQKQVYLPRILNGDHFWGQGFSEPNSGSDLASLRTSAVRSADAGREHYVVNGHKIWTTEGHYSDMLFCLVRTNKEVKPQKGISFLLIDPTTPGVTIRPIISIDEAHSLNEMFFDDVRVPLENLVGEEGQGWSFAKFLLENERAFSAEVPRNKRMFARPKMLASRARGSAGRLVDDPAFADRMAALEVDLLALEFMTLRALGEQASGRAPSWPYGSILHIRGSELIQKIGDMMNEALGDTGVVFYPEAEADAPTGLPDAEIVAGIASDYLYRRAVTIYGGSNEIQRNIIAKGYLKL